MCFGDTNENSSKVSLRVNPPPLVASIDSDAAELLLSFTAGQECDSRAAQRLIMRIEKPTVGRHPPTIHNVIIENQYNVSIGL